MLRSLLHRPFLGLRRPVECSYFPELATKLFSSSETQEYDLLVPRFSSLRDLAKQLKMKPEAVLRYFGGKSKKRFYVRYGERCFEFSSLSRVIVPYSAAASLADSLTGKQVGLDEVDPDDQLREMEREEGESPGLYKEVVDGRYVLEGEEEEEEEEEGEEEVEMVMPEEDEAYYPPSVVSSYEKMPVIALLGHFDHGKV